MDPFGQCPKVHSRFSRNVYNDAMNNSSPWFKRLFRWLFPVSDVTFSEDLRMMRPFFLLVVVGLIFLYGFSVYYQPVLRAPARLILFTLLMIIHGILHWNLPYYARSHRSGMVYALVQGLLAFVLVLLGNSASLSYGLYMSLVGELFGFLGANIFGWVAVAFSLLLSGVSTYLVQGSQDLGTWALTVGAMTFFVVVYVTMIRRLAEARERSQALLHELETAHRQLAEYADRVEDLTLAAERQRMARELHDTLSQGLAGVILQLEAADAHLSSQHNQKAQAILQQAMERARSTLADARRAIGDLRETGAPDDLGDALRGEVQRFQRATGIDCRLELDVPDELPGGLAEQVVRVAAEGLSNIARHARASQAWLHVVEKEQHLEMEIGDNGAGFDPVTASQPGHYGLLGLRERVRLNGGELEIISRPGQGTRLCMRFPLAAAEGEENNG